MNCDVVYGTSDPADLLARLGIAAPLLLETAIDDASAARGMSALEAAGAQVFLGGSAFNAARVAGLLNAGRPLAELEFFGLAGSAGSAAPHLDQLKRLGFGTADIALSPRPPATCLALVEPHGRTLLTAAGANVEIGDLLRERGEALAAGFARCNLVHLTSFLDPDVPDLLARILALARDRNPDLVVSLDPGVLWARPELPSIRALLAQCQLLHANAEELAILCADGGIEGLGKLLAPPGWTVVARSHEGATLYYGTESGVLAEAVPLADRYAVIEVVDAVGAGDTFTGALLWAWRGRGDIMAEAAQLGFAAARAKIGLLGPITAAALAGVVEQNQASR
ncbi:carbohydrate kinase family protein [Devosia sp.]